MSKYLEKYLEKKPKKEKVKSSKTKKFMGGGLRIVDSDTSLTPALKRSKESASADDVDDIFNDQLADADELPQIANFVDERPNEIKLLEEFRQADKWKTIAATALDVEPKRSRRKSDSGSDSDNSPPRSRHSQNKTKSNSQNNSHKSPNSRNNHKSIRARPQDSDESPPRHQTTKSFNRSDSDVSPPRLEKNARSNRPDHVGDRNHDRGLNRNRNSDHSPPRRGRRGKTPDSDISPPRHSQKKSSESSRRSSHVIGGHGKHSHAIRRNHSDSDHSPPRSHSNPLRRRSSSDLSPPRGRSSVQNKSSSGSLRPQRKRSSDSDISPPRQRQRQSQEQPRNSRNMNSSSPGPSSSHQGQSRNRKRQATESPPPTHKSKQTKTLDGKKAGLQTAGALKGELEHIKRIEAERFSQMEDEISGRYAKTKVRDRKTGKERDFQAEMEKQKEEEEIKNKRKAQYDKWGKGLKQVQDQEERVNAALHEMSKPLARYKDDEDLDEHLKNQDRDGDPMLAFLTKKTKKASGDPGKPVYTGPPPPPNRFGILPGYRWDGVDRSCGYEKEWFGRINARKALQDESYKWSVEDL